MLIFDAHGLGFFSNVASICFFKNPMFEFSPQPVLVKRGNTSHDARMVFHKEDEDSFILHLIKTNTYIFKLGFSLLGHEYFLI